MTNDGKLDLYALFEQACRLKGVAQTRFLDDLHRQDSAMSEQLRSLLEQDEQGGKLPQDPTTAPIPPSIVGRAMQGPSVDPSVLKGALEELSSFSPTKDRYEVLTEIGRGAMGQVHLVWDRALQRDLAMKTIRSEWASGTDASADMLGRFLGEARVTGQLDHPGIVPVHDLGVEGSEKLYFTMRRVQGRDLREIFELARREQEDWNLTRALGVVSRVCEAMAYAHSKGIIHRDLKPANIMVGQFGEVYVMDWGIARVLGQPDTRDIRVDSEPSAKPRSGLGTPLVTMDGAVIGTPCFMSPEQARGDIDDVDERSDVYAIGAILYELLSGRSPYKEHGTDNTPQAILGRLRESEPQPLAELTQSISPELVAICNKAMARLASSRYASMEDLADDLRAFLETRVVKAYRTGAVIELSKWVQRNRATAAALAIVLLLLVGGAITFAVVENRNADRERDLTSQAQRELQTRKRTLELLEKLFMAAEPGVAQGREITVREVLDVARRELDQGLAEEPEVLGRLQYSIGNSYQSLGEFEMAAKLVGAAHDNLAATLGPTALDTLLAKASLANIQEQLGKFAESLRLFRELLDAAREALGPDHYHTLGWQANMGFTFLERGDYENATPLLEDAYKRSLKAFGFNNRTTLGIANDYVHLLELTGRVEEAVELSRKILKAREESLAPLHPKTFHNMGNLGQVLSKAGRLEEAEEMFLAARKGLLQVLGENHADTYYAVKNLGQLYYLQGRYEEAEDLFRLALRKREELIGRAHKRTRDTRWSLALVLTDMERFDEAEQLLVENQDLLTLADSTAEDARKVWQGLGILYSKQDDFATALDCFARTLEIVRNNSFPWPYEASSLRRIIEIHVAEGNIERARAQLDKLVSMVPEEGRSSFAEIIAKVEAAEKRR